MLGGGRLAKPITNLGLTLTLTPHRPRDVIQLTENGTELLLLTLMLAQTLTLTLTLSASLTLAGELTDK